MNLPTVIKWASFRFLLGLTFLSIASTAQADWVFVEDWAEPTGNFQTNAAVNKNADGFTIHLYRSPLGRVMALYTWPDGTGNLRQNGKVALLEPDGFPAKAIEARTEQGRFVEYATVTQTYLRDRLWHGEGGAPVGTLADIFSAPSLTLTLYREDSSGITTTWSMDNSHLPIAQALGLTLDGVPAGAAWEDDASQEMLAAMTACQFPELDMACIQRVTACSPQISDHRDIDAFRACVSTD